MLPLLNYHLIMFLNLSLSQRIPTSNSNSLRLDFLLCLAISYISCFCQSLSQPYEYAIIRLFHIIDIFYQKICFFRIFQLLNYIFCSIITVKKAR